MTAIVETKRPQLIYTSNAFTTTEEALKPVAEVQANSPGHNSRLRRLSTVNAMHRKMAKSILLSRNNDGSPLLPSALALTADRPGAFTMLSRSRSSSEINKDAFSMLSRSRAASIMEEEEEDHHDEAVAVMNEFGLAPTSFIDVVKVARHSSKLHAATSRRPVEEDEAGEGRKNSTVPFSPSAMLAAGTADEEEEDKSSESSESSNEDGDDTHNCYEGSSEKNKAAAEALMQTFGQKLAPLRSMDTTGEGNQNSSVRKKLSNSLEMSKTIGRSMSQEKLGIQPGNHMIAFQRGWV